MPAFLAEVRISGLRGLTNLRVPFQYPVSVIAGENASGKSTILFAAACAYKVPNAGPRDYVPSTLFPDFRPKVQHREDEQTTVTIEFDYDTPDGRYFMRWRRSKGWNRSFGGRKGGSQPTRDLYLRTLSNLSNPSEVRGVLSMTRLASEPKESPLTASQIAFAHRILAFEYSEVVDLSSGKKKLLFASQKTGAQYSELHMAAGERAILRLSQEIAQLRDALVLIDEVEAGLHPWVQQLLMIQLQELALRNDLQIIVTTHSPVVIESVPSEGRIFLARGEDGQVHVLPPYQDIIQDALYGRTNDSLKVLCEDESAEAMLRGIIDVLRPRHNLTSESIRIGRDTGADEFPTHAAAFQKFGRIDSFIFVLDGDKRESNIEHRIHANAKGDATIMYLPGTTAPEVWVWGQVQTHAAHMSLLLGSTESQLQSELDRIERLFSGASDPDQQTAKTKLHELAQLHGIESATICRYVARHEAEQPASDIQPLMEEIELALAKWRST